MTRKRSIAPVPPLVRRAVALAERLGSTHSRFPEVGRLPAAVATHVESGVIGQIGTGCGIETAGMASAISPETRVVTVELDAARAEEARRFFAPVPNVRVLSGDGRDLLPHGPFDLLFADGDDAKRCAPEAVLEAVRRFWLGKPRLLAREVVVGPTMAVILATRLADGVRTPQYE